MRLRIEFDKENELDINGRFEFHIFDIKGQGRKAGESAWCTIGCFLDDENLAKINNNEFIHVCIFDKVEKDGELLNDVVIDVRNRPRKITINS